LAHLDILAPERKRGRPCRNLQTFYFCQRVQQLLGKSVTEIVVCRDGGKVCERKHRDPLIYGSDRSRSVFAIFGTRFPNRSDKTIAPLGNRFDKGSLPIAL